MTVRAAPMSQQRMSRPGDLTWRATSELTMKMPEPIMDPMTSVVAEVRPRPLTKVAVCVATGFEGVMRLILLSMAGRVWGRRSRLFSTSPWVRLAKMHFADGEGPGRAPYLPDLNPAWLGFVWQ